ncbi:hypothetical protein [Pseudonocardia acaciae]|uniref:hypothetical protein n=1 Tax=Pseudonocardia acaciae TaxID=551276 RepID=UPI0006877B68|nr:hypothetical protein [Pseudonocardia acaciae]
MAEVNLKPGESPDDTEADDTTATAEPAATDVTAEPDPDAEPDADATADPDPKPDAKPDPDDPKPDDPKPEADSEAEATAVSEPAAEPEPDADASEPPTTVLARIRRPSRVAVLAAGLAVLLVGLAAAGTMLFLRNSAADELAGQRAAALDSARKVATDLTSMSADNAQQRIESLTQGTTGGFRAQLSTYAAVLEAILRQTQAGSRGTVSEAGIEKIDDTSASVLLAVSATVSNTRAPTAQPLTYRMVVQLQREGDRWLASDVNFVQ